MKKCTLGKLCSAKKIMLEKAYAYKILECEVDEEQEKEGNERRKKG